MDKQSITIIILRQKYEFNPFSICIEIIFYMVSDKMVVIKMHSDPGGIKEGRNLLSVINQTLPFSVTIKYAAAEASKQAGKIYYKEI